MIIGVPKEVKNSEYRVGLTEVNVGSLVKRGHKVLVQKNAGEGSHIFDESYSQAGADLVDTLPEIYKNSDMIVKVKEPLPEEYDLFKENQILFTFLHLAAEPELTESLCSKKIKSVAYETIESKEGELPLLKPMSQVAGRVGLQNGIYYLQKHQGGKGILAGGVLGVKQAHIVILGGGTAGIHAAKMAVGLEAEVTILDISQEKLKSLDQFFAGKVKVLLSNKESLSSIVKEADLLIGSVLLKGEKTPKLVTEKMIQTMSKDSVVVDISIDQGGCIETAHPTSHENPIYRVHDVIHYCVPNIPSSVPRTSTYALTNVSFPYVLEIADQGLEAAIKNNAGLSKGLNTYAGHVTYLPVSKALHKECKSFKDLSL